MMIRHHPSPEILTAYTCGTLRPGAMLIVASHLETCPSCRKDVALWEDCGGALLAEGAVSTLSAGALERIFNRLDEGEETAPQRPPVRVPRFLQRFDMPAALVTQSIPYRRWVTPRIWFAPVAVEFKSTSRTYLVYAGKNTTLPMHGHAGREFTHVITGRFSDRNGSYGPGDFLDADSALDHAPTVSSEYECLCLISADAPLRLRGVPAQLLQAMIGKLY